MTSPAVSLGGLTQPGEAWSNAAVDNISQVKHSHSPSPWDVRKFAANLEFYLGVRESSRPSVFLKIYKKTPKTPEMTRIVMILVKEKKKKGKTKCSSRRNAEEIRIRNYDHSEFYILLPIVPHPTRPFRLYTSIKPHTH